MEDVLRQPDCPFYGKIRVTHAFKLIDAPCGSTCAIRAGLLHLFGIHSKQARCVMLEEKLIPRWRCCDRRHVDDEEASKLFWRPYTSNGEPVLNQLGESIAIR